MYVNTSANVGGKRGNTPRDSHPVLHTSLTALQNANIGFGKELVNGSRPTARLMLFFLSTFLKSVSGSEL